MRAMKDDEVYLTARTLLDIKNRFVDYSGERLEHKGYQPALDTVLLDLCLSINSALAVCAQHKTMRKYLKKKDGKKLIKQLPAVLCLLDPENYPHPKKTYVFIYPGGEL